MILELKDYIVTIIIKRKYLEYNSLYLNISRILIKYLKGLNK